MLDILFNLFLLVASLAHVKHSFLVIWEFVSREENLLLVRKIMNILVRIFS
jgi:hypothetical protein